MSIPWRMSANDGLLPERRANPSRRRSTAGGAADPGSDIPIASAALAIVFAGVHTAAGALAWTDRAF